FFQAEDGIRDRNVTGVQTCALPILRALHATVDGRVETVADATSLAEFEPGEIYTHDAIDLIVKAIEQVVRTMREVHDPIDEADPTTADLLHEYIASLEQQAWFISAETRKPSA